MSPDAVIEIFRSALQIVVLLVTSMIIPGLIIGLIVAMFQAATQINEMSLSFLPKLIITLLLMVVAAPWYVNVMVDYTTNLYQQIPNFIG